MNHQHLFTFPHLEHNYVSATYVQKIESTVILRQHRLRSNSRLIVMIRDETDSSWTRSPHWNWPRLSTPVAMSEQSCRSLGSTSSSCIVRSENNTTRFSSTRTISPVSPSYRPDSTFTWSPVRNSLRNSLAWNSRGSYRHNRAPPSVALQAHD